MQCHVETERLKTENKESIVQTIAKVIMRDWYFQRFGLENLQICDRIVNLNTLLVVYIYIYI